MNGTRWSRVFHVVVAIEIETAIAASPNQSASQRSLLTDAAASHAASRAVAPIAIWPHPDTAVNDPARSIVSRMKRRLSSAFA